MNNMNVSTRSFTYTNRWLVLLLVTGMMALGLFLSQAIVNNLLLAGVVVGGVACAVLYFHPLWGLYLLVALIPFQIFPMAFFGSDYTWSVAQLLVKFLFVVTVVRIVQSGRFRFSYSPLNLWIVLFMLVPVFSTLNAPDMREHIKETIPAVIDLFLLYFVVLNNVDTKRRLQILVGILLGTTLVVAAVGTLQYLWGAGTIETYLLSDMAPLFVAPGYVEVRSPFMLSQIQTGQFKSVTSIFVNHSDYGGFLLYSFPVALGLFLVANKPKQRALYGALAFLFGFNILVSLARSAWLGLGASLVVASVWVLKHKPGIVGTSFAVGALVLLVGIGVGFPYGSLLPATVLDRIEETAFEGTLSTSWQTRLGWWQDQVDAVSRTPLLGTGVRFKAHSQYFGLLLLFGVLGLTLHLIIMGLAGYMLFRAYRSSGDRYLKGVALGACASLVALSAHSLLWNDLFSVPATDMLFALFLGLAAVLPRLVSREDVVPAPLNPSAISISGYGFIAGFVLLIVAVSISLLVAALDFSPFDLYSYAALVVVILFVLTSVSPVGAMHRKCKS